MLAEFSSNESLQDVMTRLTKASADFGTVYEDMRRIGISDHDTRSKVDIWSWRRVVLKGITKVRFTMHGVG